MYYVLKFNGKYVSDFGYPNPSTTKDINKAAVWFTRREIFKNARENGFILGDNIVIQECGLKEV